VNLELVILGLLVVIAGVGTLAQRLRVPYPILLVVCGLGLGFVPGIGRIDLEPDLVLLIFLPPLLYAAAFFNNPRELARNVRPIGLLAIGLVFATTAGVAAVAHWVVGLSWPVALVLGAVVSPTDVVAPSTIVRRLGVPRRVVTVIEGENLTNDWTALTIYRFAIAAVTTGTFSLAEAAPRFLLTGVGGVAVGLAAGWLTRRLRRRLDDPPTEIAVSLFTGYAAYLPAEELGLSGVIAAVTVGLYMGWHASELTTPATRLQLAGVWGALEFLLNAVLFVLVGLQLPSVLDRLSGQSTGELLGWAAAISAAVIGIRLVWVFVLTYAPRRLSPALAARDPSPPWRVTTVVAWCSMRGSVALAAALAIPETVASGAAFPARDLVIFLAYAVILVTLVAQGLTLPALIRRLGVQADDLDEREEIAARVRAAEAAIARIDELADADWVNDDTAERTRGLYEFRRRRFAERADGDADGRSDRRSERYQRLLHEVIAAERRAIIDLRNRGEITDQVMRRVERDLDLEEARLEA